MLIFGVPSDRTRIEFKRKCGEEGLCCCAIAKVEREGENFRIPLKPLASTEWQRIETKKVSAWVRRLGWRVCIANGIAKLRRSPRAHEGKMRQETVRGPKGMGEKHRGAERADKTRDGSEKKAQRRENRNTRSDNGEGTDDRNRVENQPKKKLRIGSRNVCVFAAKNRKRNRNCQTSK